MLPYEINLQRLINAKQLCACGYKENKFARTCIYTAITPDVVIKVL